MKLLIAFLILYSITGCVGSKTVALDTEGNPIMRETIFGGTKPVYDTLSRSAVISKNSTEKSVAASNAPPEQNPCGLLLEVKMLTASGEAEQARSFGDCMDGYYDKQSIAVALNRPTTDVQAIEQGATSQIRATEENQTARTGQLASLGTRGVVAVSLSSAVKNGQNAQRDQSISAGENAGDVTANIQTGNSASVDSTDGGSGVGGAGTGGMGSGAGGVGTGGTASVDVAQTSSDQFIIGKGNVTSTASDEGRLLVNPNQSNINESFSEPVNTNDSEIIDLEGEAVNTDDDSAINL